MAGGPSLTIGAGLATGIRWAKVVAFKRDVYRRALKELSQQHSEFEDTECRSGPGF